MKTTYFSARRLFLITFAAVAIVFAAKAAQAADDTSTAAPAAKTQTHKRPAKTLGKTATGKTAAPEIRVAPNKSAIVNCEPGDAKCVEDAAKLETKPTDGAIHDQTN